MRSLSAFFPEAIVILAVMTGGSPAWAQTATPTPADTATPTATSTGTPQPCAGTKKLYVFWKAKDPLNPKVTVSATHCAAPPLCETAIDVVTVPPLTLTVTDSNGQSFSATAVGPGVGTGCPSGHDTYRTSADRLRLIYGGASNGFSTTLIGKMTAPQAHPAPPTLTSPITFTLRDSGGYGISGTVSTCFTRTTAKTTYLKCF